MPIFEYRCEECDCIFEHLVLNDKDAEPKCPTCCGKRTKRLMSAASFRPAGIPKGSGGFKAPNCRPSGG
jgi:putative FmdB family regulatory protein